MSEIYKNLELNDLPNEIWKDIEGYENYQVSSYGRVKSIRDKYGNSREKILKQIIFKNDYLKVNLCKEGKVKAYYVHRLVAIAFIQNPSNLPTVNHINEDKTDNRACNLEWMNISQQQRHGTCQQRRVEKLSRQVYQYDKNRTLVAIWESVNEAGRNGYSQGAVSACCRNCFNRDGNNFYKGYIWSYIPINSK